MNSLKATVLLTGLIVFSNALADLVVYDVDPKYRQEVFSALRAVLQQESAGAGYGSVAMLPTGQLLIDTTAARHAQVEAVLRAIAEHQAEAAPQVTLRYWAVLGSRDPAAAGPLPAILDDTLDELQRIHGEMAFHLIGNATLVTESGQSGSINGIPISVQQQAYVQGTTLNAELTIRYLYTFEVPNTANREGQPAPFSTVQREAQSVELNTSMRQGEFVVVGENSVEHIAIGEESLDGTIFFIVHWPAAG